MPVKAAGMRIEPPPSLPVAIGPHPVATATADPPDEPPGVRRGFHGLRVTPESGLSVTAFQAKSGMVVRAYRIAPASRNRATCGASSSVAGKRSSALLPAVSGCPATAWLSLMATGIPSSGDSGAPAAQRASLVRA